MATDQDVIDWLLAGDPAIRWQVMRDLLDEPAETWERERAGSSKRAGWPSCSRARGADGEWPAGRWTASTWTLLLLVALGLPEAIRPAAAPLERLLDRFIPPDREVNGASL